MFIDSKIMVLGNLTQYNPVDVYSCLGEMRE